MSSSTETRDIGSGFSGKGVVCVERKSKGDVNYFAIKVCVY
jgi:hypothetical protein